MKKFFKSCFLLFTLMLVNQVYAQDRTVTGTVTTTEEGQPLNGVSVLVPGYWNPLASAIEPKIDNNRL